jgi:hypothetical protein
MAFFWSQLSSDDDPGNEEADRLAKEGAVEVPHNQFTTVCFR